MLLVKYVRIFCRQHFPIAKVNDVSHLLKPFELHLWVWLQLAMSLVENHMFFVLIQSSSSGVGSFGGDLKNYTKMASTAVGLTRRALINVRSKQLCAASQCRSLNKTLFATSSGQNDDSDKARTYSSITECGVRGVTLLRDPKFNKVSTAYICG